MILGPMLGSILGPDRITRGQDEPKKAIKSLQILHLQKDKKTLCFSRFLEVKGRQKQLQRDQNGSQEVAARKWTCFLLFFRPILEPFWGPFRGVKSCPKSCPKIGPNMDPEKMVGVGLPPLENPSPARLQLLVQVQV